MSATQGPRPVRKNFGTAPLWLDISACCYFYNDENGIMHLCGSPYSQCICIPANLIPLETVQETIPNLFDYSDKRETCASPQKMSWPAWSWSIEVTSLSKTDFLIILPVLKLNTWCTEKKVLPIKWQGCMNERLIGSSWHSDQSTEP